MKENETEEGYILEPSSEFYESEHGDDVYYEEEEPPSNLQRIAGLIAILSVLAIGQFYGWGLAILIFILGSANNAARGI